MLKPKFEEFEMTREELIEHYWKMNKLIFEESGSIFFNFMNVNPASLHDVFVSSLELVASDEQ